MLTTLVKAHIYEDYFSWENTFDNLDKYLQKESSDVDKAGTS